MAIFDQKASQTFRSDVPARLTARSLPGPWRVSLPAARLASFCISDSECIAINFILISN